MIISIELVKKFDYREIFEFEAENKDFFESVLPLRNEGYYQFDSFVTIMDQLMTEQEAGQFYMYLIRDSNNTVVGRINLQINEEEGDRKAELGYRVGKAFQGNGYASKAVKLIINEAFTHLSVMEVYAGTAKNNAGSRKVLEKNGFVMVGEEKDVLMVNGTWVDGVMYSRVVEDSNKTQSACS